MTTSTAIVALYFAVPVLFVFIIESIITFMGLPKFYKLNPIRWLPKGWIFGVAWVILFVLMAWGGTLYYINEPNNDNQINFLSVFYIQLLFNFLWVAIFFGAPSEYSGRFALMIMLFLILSVIYLTVVSWGVSKVAFSFFIVYLAWLVFATILNISFVVGLNRKDLINI